MFRIFSFSVCVAMISASSVTAQSGYVGNVPGLAWSPSLNAYVEVTTPAPSFRVANRNGQGVAQRKAEIQARAGRMFHPERGRYAPGARFEGVGYSTRSANDAIRNCCYWGKRQPVEIGVARGPRGWFACVQYR